MIRFARDVCCGALAVRHLAGQRALPLSRLVCHLPSFEVLKKDAIARHQPLNCYRQDFRCFSQSSNAEPIPKKKKRKPSTKKPKHKLQPEKEKEKGNEREKESVPLTGSSGVEVKKDEVKKELDEIDRGRGRSVPGPWEASTLWTGRTSRIVKNVADDMVALMGNLENKTILTVDPSSKSLLEAFLNSNPVEVIALCSNKTAAPRMTAINELRDEHKNLSVYMGDIVTLDWAKMSANITTVELLKNCPRVPRDVQANVIPFLTIFNFQTTRLITIMMMKLHENVGVYQWGRVDTYMLMPAAIAEFYTRPGLHSRQALIVKMVAEVECVAELYGDPKDPQAVFKLLRFTPILKSLLTVEIVVLAYLGRSYHTIHGGRQFQQLSISTLLRKLCPGGDSILEIAGVDPDLFPCQLTLKEHADIANAFKDYKYAPRLDEMGYVA